MLSPKDYLIGKYFNDDPTHHHGGSDDRNDQGSSTSVDGTAISGITAIAGEGSHHSVGAGPNLDGEEVESPLLIPPLNVIDLDLKFTAVQVV